jgi:hypothetical protein
MKTLVMGSIIFAITYTGWTIIGLFFNTGLVYPEMYFSAPYTINERIASGLGKLLGGDTYPSQLNSLMNSIMWCMITICIEYRLLPLAFVGGWVCGAIGSYKLAHYFLGVL